MVDFLRSFTKYTYECMNNTNQENSNLSNTLKILLTIYSCWELE